MVTLDVFRDPDGLARAAADAVVTAAAAAIRRHGAFTWCLSGGRTPAVLYGLLAGPPYATRIPWDRTSIFFGDERCVPPDAPASNYRMAREALLRRVPVPEARVYRIAGEHDPAAAAAAYETTLCAVLGGTPSGAPARGFDLTLLGMGDDGHTASLFPFSVDEPDRWTSPRLDPARTMWRVTLLPRVLNASAEIRFLVDGASKAARLAEVLDGPRRPDALPVQRIVPTHGAVTWMVDRAAAAALLARRRERRDAERLTVEIAP